MSVQVKFCGLSRPEDIVAAGEAGAAYIGFVHFAKSPRHVEIDRMGELAALVPAGIRRVALTVNADDALLEAITGAASIDMLQLHGSETPERVAEIRARFGLPVMKAIGVANADDLAAIEAYAPVADQLLIDAKPPKNADLPGGNGLAFDWRLLQSRAAWPLPWMLAGGLTPENAAQAVRLTGATQLDVSSGVESAPGVKSAEAMRRFADAVK